MDMTPKDYILSTSNYTNSTIPIPIQNEQVHRYEFPPQVDSQHGSMSQPSPIHEGNLLLDTITTPKQHGIYQ